MPNVLQTKRCDGKPVFSVALYGPNTTQSTRELAVIHGAHEGKIFLIKSVSTADDPGFREIWTPGQPTHETEGFDATADAVMLSQPGQAVGHFTADCSVFWLYDAVAHRGIAGHAGRPAMTPSNNLGESISNIITDCWEALRPTDPTQVLVKIMGSIDAEDFRHQDEVGQELVEPFDQFGQYAFQDRKLGTLDLPRIIRVQLVELGVRLSNIKTIGPSTLKTDWLASYRRDRTTDRNQIIVVLH